MQAHIKNDGQKESVNRSEIIMGGVNPIVLYSRVGERSSTHQPPQHRTVYLQGSILEQYLVSACYQKS